MLTQSPWESGDEGVKSGVARSDPEIFILRSHLVDVTGKEMLSGEEEAHYGEGGCSKLGTSKGKCGGLGAS